MMELFDLLVVGGGPGGYLCAERAAQGGMKVALFEKRALGGTCLNEGCIPTKTLLNSSKMYRHATESEAYGVTVSGVTYDHAKVVARKNNVVKTLVAGVGATMSANKVTVITGDAVITGRTDDGFAVTANGTTYTGRRLAIASGSETVIPPVPGLKEGLAAGFVVTNREVLDLTELPKELVVIGGGVIGLEMAYYFASVGVKVTVIEMMPKIAGATDPEICKVLSDAFEKRGMVFKLSSKVLEVKTNSVIYEENGEQKEIACDKVLLSAGRRPATAGIGLETLGLQMDRAAIVTDRHMCTTVQNVYAVGDCNGKSMLAHTAYREAEVAVNHMLGKNDEMRYDVIPAVIYTDPEVASIGHSKEGAEKLGMNVKEVKLPMSYAGRYLAETNGGKGFIKLVVDTDRNRLVGCHMVGSYASEIIMTATMMVDTELTPDRLKKLVFPHPTVAEIIREAIFHI
jgi:dihydrolipoamide dehydrogenase